MKGVRTGYSTDIYEDDCVDDFVKVEVEVEVGIDDDTESRGRGMLLSP